MRGGKERCGKVRRGEEMLGKVSIGEQGVSRGEQHRWAEVSRGDQR